MKLIIKSFLKSEYDVEVDKNASVLEVKNEIEKKHKVLSSNILLLSNGKVLQDSEKLDDSKSQILMIQSKIKPKNVDLENVNENINVTSSGQLSEIKKTKKPVKSPIYQIASVIKVLCQKDLSDFKTIMLVIKKRDPKLFKILQRNEELFNKYLNEPISESDFEIYNKNQRLVKKFIKGKKRLKNNFQDAYTEFTDQEIESIKKLQELTGYKKTIVTNAFFACDKDLEKAANYLLEMMLEKEFYGNDENGEENENKDKDSSNSSLDKKK